jgi:hypothetical protein
LLLVEGLEVMQMMRVAVVVLADIWLELQL